MSSVESLALNGATTSLIQGVLPFKNQHTVSLIEKQVQLISCVGVLASTAMVIYGLAINIFVHVAVGAIFLVTSLSSLYFFNRVKNLKDIEEDISALKTLDKSLQQKDAKIVELTSQIKEISQKISDEKISFVSFMEQDNALQKKYNQLLHDSAELLSKSENEARQTLDRTSQDLKVEIEDLKKRSVEDQTMIRELKQTVASYQEQNVSLKSSLSQIQQQIDEYKKQIADYAEINQQFSKQIKSLSEILRRPNVDCSAIAEHAEKLEKQVAAQSSQRDKTLKEMKEFSALLRYLQNSKK